MSAREALLRKMQAETSCAVLMSMRGWAREHGVWSPALEETYAAKHAELWGRWL